MKVGIRAKEVALLTLVALLPLLVALTLILLIETDLRRKSIGLTVRSAAASEAHAMQVRLARDIEKIELALHGPAVLAELGKLDTARSGPDLAALDAAWPTLPASSPLLVSVLEHPIGSVLRLIREYDPRVVEIFVTDRFGQLVAATGRTSDFYQADEDWWTRAAQDGEGCVFLPGINYDQSAGVWSIDLCIPILAEGRFVGVAKAVLDAAQLIGDPTRPLGGLDAALTIARADGTIIYRAGVTPLTERASDWHGPITQRAATGWRRTPTGEIQGFAPIHLPSRIGPYAVDMPGWSVVLSVPEHEAMAPVRQLTLLLLAAGVVVIIAVYLGGIVLVERMLVRRIARIGQAARLVAGGDLSFRTPEISAPWHGRDEIDGLARDFNEMVARLQRSYYDLREADELKTDFIRIAGHELRTPVAYIIGAGSLLKGSSDPAALSKSLQTCAAKGRRLDEIIRAMFKLMPGQDRTAALRLTTFNVADLIEELRRECQPLIDQRHQRLILETGASPLTIRADREKLRDMLENLLINAIKFTPDDGRITIRAGHRSAEEISIAVHNEGPPIPEYDFSHLFEPFFCGKDSLHHSTGTSGYQKRGMGLGLAIVRHFARLHGGTVAVSSGPSGTEFTITLPAAPLPAPGAVVTASGGHAPTPDAQPSHRS